MKSKKILIIQTAFIGDVVLTTPLIKMLKNNFDTSEITFLGNPAGCSVLKNNPHLEEIIPYDKRGTDKGLRGFLRLSKIIKKRDFDIVICPHRYLRSSLLSFCSGAAFRFGYKEAAFSLVFNRKLAYPKNYHEVERLLDFGLALVNEENKQIEETIETKVEKIEKYPIELYPSAENKTKVDELFAKANIEPTEKIVLMAPGSKWETKKWPLEYFRELVMRLEMVEEVRVIIVGGPDEAGLTFDLNNKSLNLIGQTSLLDMAELTKRALVVVTNDSAPLHIACASKDTHVVAIFGPTTEELGFFPWSKNSIVYEDRTLPCRPCGLHGQKKCPQKHFKCMLGIKPETIYHHIIKKLGL